MTVSPFTITPATPGLACPALEVGQVGRLVFTVASLAAPDRVHEVILTALLVGGDGKGKAVDWLVVEPRTASLAGGKSEVVTISIRPDATTPGGTFAARLAVADRARVDDAYTESPPVVFEVARHVPDAVDGSGASLVEPSPEAARRTVERADRAPAPRATARSRWWWIPAAVGGLGALGGLVWMVVWLTCARPVPGGSLATLGEPCGGSAGRACGKGLLCMPGVQTCLLAGGARCEGGQAARCASGECVREVCAIPLGVACVPGDAARPCPALAACDAATKTCVKRQASAACTPGARQCTSDAAAIRVCASDGSWRTEPCPANAALCRDGTCQCSPNQGKPCNCDGTRRCDGTCSAPVCSGTCKAGMCCQFSADPACGGAPAQARRADFNRHVLLAIDRLYQSYRARGYGSSSFTHDLDYAQPGEIKAGPHPPATMCVAAVSEVIITALRLYADETGDRSVFEKLPGRSWMKSSSLDIRPYMYLYDNVESSGTADALVHFGIGEHRAFPALVPGDFIGLNRDNGTGHAVVFLGFLNASGGLEPAYDATKVVGFKYFSAQGRSAPDGGLGYRWAFFGACPSWREADKPRDCGIIASDKQNVLNTGYMLHPSLWSTAPAMRNLKTALTRKHGLAILSKRLRRLSTERDLARLSRGELRQLDQEATRSLTLELPAISRLKFDGATTDD